ncbi:UNVERIFIED_ORG: hypothetical protein BCL66_10583 [Martelella mediterranea]
MKIDSVIRAYGEPGNRADSRNADERTPRVRRKSPGLAAIVLLGLAFWTGLALLLVTVI